MRLLEREHPLAVLQQHTDRAARGHGSVVLVAGEAGIGKTVLLRALADTPHLPPTLWGICDALSTPRPLSPLWDMAHDLDEAVFGLLRDRAAQHEIFAAVLSALSRRPRVLVVEDLHWADGATLDLVRFLARRIDGLPLLLAVSYRDSLTADHPLSAALGDLVTSTGARRLQLAPLSQTAVAQLLAGHEADPTEVHRRTGGNPFFVSQIVAQPESPLPDSVRDAVLARVAHLPAADRRCLELLSCMPEAIEADLLAALDVSRETVEALAATGVVDRDGRGLAFRHDIARLSILRAVPPGAEPPMHARIIEALETVHGDASLLSHHAEAAGDTVRILRYAPVAAADAEASGARREAVQFYELALRHADDPAVRATLLENMSIDLYYTDRLTEAVRARQQGLSIREELGDVVAVGADHRALSALAWFAADRPAAEHHDRAAIDILTGTGDVRELGFALANRAYLAAQRGDLAAAQDAGGLAERIAADLADPALRGTVTVPMAIGRLLGGQVEARTELLEVRDVGLKHRLDELATTPMSNLAHLDVQQGRLQDAEKVLAEALPLTQERGVLICNMWQRGVRARLRLLQGDWDAAEADAWASLATGHFPLGRLWPHLVLGVLAARREGPSTNDALDEAWRLALQLGDPGKLVPVAAALVEQAWITRRPDPRLARSEVTGLTGSVLHDASTDELRAWWQRLAAAGVQDVPPDAAPVRALTPAESPYDRALGQWDRGTRDDLLAALPALDDLGARPVAARFRARLRELGVDAIPRGPLPATRANAAGLTARQLDVLALLSDGLNNADIADRLVISRKTADHHVSAILTKLNVRSRGEAVAAARRLGV